MQIKNKKVRWLKKNHGYILFSMFISYFIILISLNSYYARSVVVWIIFTFLIFTCFAKWLMRFNINIIKDSFKKYKMWYSSIIKKSINTSSYVFSLFTGLFSFIIIVISGILYYIIENYFEYPQSSNYYYFAGFIPSTIFIILLIGAFIYFAINYYYFTRDNPKRRLRIIYIILHNMITMFLLLMAMVVAGILASAPIAAIFT